MTWNPPGGGLLSSQQLLTLAQLSHRLPQRPHVSTIYRWTTRGIGGHRLRSHKIGNRRMVTVADAEAFFAACSAPSAAALTADLSSRPLDTDASPHVLRQRHLQALKRLDDRGV